MGWCPQINRGGLFLSCNKSGNRFRSGALTCNSSVVSKFLAKMASMLVPPVLGTCEKQQMLLFLLYVVDIKLFLMIFLMSYSILGKGVCCFV